MNLTPKQLRKIIEESRLHILKTHKKLEVYEAIIHDHPGMLHIPNTQIKVLEDLKLLREKIMIVNKKFRKDISVLENVLAQDEAMNGWKGEDRIVELVSSD